MDAQQEQSIHRWLVEQGLYGLKEEELLNGFCRQCLHAGLEVSRSVVLLDTLHPNFEGRAYSWRSDAPEATRVIEYGRTSEGEAAASWQRSPLFALVQSGESEQRVRIRLGEGPEFPVMAEFAQEGHTDYLAFVHRLAPDSVIGEMDSLYSQWLSRDPGGFSDRAVMALRNLVPALSLAMKCAAMSRVSRTLAKVYLGRDPARRVLGGKIIRGVADRIAAVLWFSDLRGYSTLADTAEPGEIMPLLNDYADATISAIHDAGGDVLKLMGDGVLAIFADSPVPEASRAALRAECDLRSRLAVLNADRIAGNRPTSSVYVGLHAGEVFYGNIGSRDRLDFTVIGPAVNEVSRIAGMCRSVDRSLLVSTEVREALDPEFQAELVSVGRFALRGMGRAQDLFTPDPGIASSAGRMAIYRRHLGLPHD